MAKNDNKLKSPLIDKSKKHKILIGNSLDLLDEIKNNSCNLVFADPPRMALLLFQDYLLLLTFFCLLWVICPIHLGIPSKHQSTMAAGGYVKCPGAAGFWCEFSL